MSISAIKSRFWNKKWKFVPNRKRGEAANNQFIFLHIPKTAGTTFRFILYNHFNKEDIYPTQAELKQNGGLYLNTKSFLEQKKYENKSMVVGHFHHSVANRIESTEVKQLAFFRNPIDRILSTIKHIQAHDAEFKNADVNIILEKHWHRIMHGQCITMGFNFKKRNMPIVRQNIIDLDFIGITEYFQESIQLCNATFDWKLENIEPRNVLKEEIFNQLSTKSKVKMSRGLGVELHTYNIALNHFRQRCKKHDIELPY